MTSDARKYFDEGIFGPGGLLEAETPTYGDRVLMMWPSEDNEPLHFNWEHPTNPVVPIACRDQEAANACRCAAEDWLHAQGLYVGPDHMIDASERIVGGHQHSTIHDAIIAAIKSLKGEV